MQDSEEAGLVAADELIICDKHFDCLRRGGKQCRVGFSLVASEGRSQLLGDGKGDHKVVAGKLAFQLSVEPLSGFVILADRAMPITAGAVTDMDVSATATIVNHEATGGGSAADDGL